MCLGWFLYELVGGVSYIQVKYVCTTETTLPTSVFWSVAVHIVVLVAKSICLCPHVICKCVSSNCITHYVQLKPQFLAAQREAHSVSCCAITFDENYVSFFAFEKREVSSDVVEGKTLTAKGAGHNPTYRRLCKTPVGAAHTTEAVSESYSCTTVCRTPP